MSAAFVAACEVLHLKVGDDPATRFVAEKVIELAQRGIRDPDELRTTGAFSSPAAIAIRIRAQNASSMLK
jgi:hypothetical protein